MSTPLVRVRYKNISGSAVPAYGVIQFVGDPELTDTDDYVMQATTPGSGTGPYFIDSGKGTAATDEGQYGICHRAGEGLMWLKYGGGAGPLTAWTPVGPVTGQFYCNQRGGGFLYAGVFDDDNDRMLVLKSQRSVPIWIKTASTISVGDPATPSTFTVNAWIKSGSTWPYTQAVATDPDLLALTVVNRNPGLENTSTGVVGQICWDEELSEYIPVWMDC